MAKPIRDKPAQLAGETDMMLDPRPCERECIQCHEWKHHSRYRTWTRRYSTVSTLTFADRCRDCEQKNRNIKKNLDRPKAIIEQRARTAAHKAGVGFDFFWMQMNYRALVPQLRAMMSPEGICVCCGHDFLNERDIQIEHCDPPHGRQDWARLHARNLRLTCGSCNRSKGHKPYSQWLEEQEGARLSNLERPTPIVAQPAMIQGAFDFVLP